MSKNNKLIAEFMEGNYVGYPKFDKSWDALMHVINKISGITSRDRDIFPTYVTIKFTDRTTKIQSGSYKEKEHSKKYFNKNFGGNTSLDATYKAVVEFIKWYNQ